MMTTTEIKSIRKSFQLMEGKTDLVAALFYNRLFQLDPSLRPLFRGDMKEQGKKLMDTMAVLNGSLERFHTLVDTLRHMGKRHAQYGVRPEHYTTVGAALLQTLQEFAGPKFDSAIQDAWIKLLTLVSGEMLEGANAASIDPAPTAAW
jgi:hemoglobin-like flavoprotein